MTSDPLAAHLRASGFGLIPYVMGGFPDHARSVALARRYATSGAVALEIGIPHSDPLADGPVIQAAGHRALAAGATVAACLEVAAAAAAEKAAPVVLMTYLNPVLAYGLERFAADARSAGVAGLILPDVPVDEAEPLAPLFERVNLAMVMLAAPTSTSERLRRIADLSRGFVYAVTVTGITGVRQHLSSDTVPLLRRLREVTQLPVAAGFGIATAAQVADLSEHCDAVVVASALLREIMEGRDSLPLLESLVRACR